MFEQFWRPIDDRFFGCGPPPKGVAIGQVVRTMERIDFITSEVLE
jgi:hypothetical protein